MSYTSYLSYILYFIIGNFKKKCLIWCTILSRTWKLTPSAHTSSLAAILRCRSILYLLGDLFLSVCMCTGNPRSRETGVSCADWQRPAAVPLPAWEQGGPKQPHQESSAHHHQVQYNSTLRFYSVEHSIRPPYWGDLGLETCQWVCFYWRDNKNRLTLSITRLLDSFPVDITLVWKTWVKPESMSHVFPSFQSHQSFLLGGDHFSNKHPCILFCWL